MPNWCNNAITIRHEDPAKVRAAYEAFKEGKFLNYFIPVPEDLMREGSSTHGGPEAATYDQIRAENRAKHGYDSWYDFCTSNWGTKWDVGDTGIEDLEEGAKEFSVGFDSAWAPPVGVYQKMIEDGWQITAYYYEPGMAFAGRYDNENGDDYIEFGDMKSHELREVLPDDIDETFGITESMEEWERENEEDLTRWVREGADKLGLVEA
jgi:hypothetical protein